MFDSLRIQNFRAFDELKINQLSCINLFTGRNGSGKTTLLEALFLLCGAGNPNMALNAGVIRSIGKLETAAVPEIFWKPMFNFLDVKKRVEIKVRHLSLGSLALNISLELPDTIKPPLNVLDSTSVSDSILLLSFRKGSKTVNGSIRVAAEEPEGFKIERPTSRLPFQAVILLSCNGSPQENAMRLGKVRRQKKVNLVVDALRIIEPRLQDIEGNSASGDPMIMCDIGLSELIPLSVMGEGMVRITRLILAISDAPNGIVLVDEIENGFHHSILNEVWQAIDVAARKFGTQIIASTHNFECVQAAQKSLEKDSFLVHRLENVDDKISCITYEPDEISAAISHGLEVR